MLMVLPTDYQKFIYKRTYSRWLEEEKRREDWDESVDRYRDFFLDRLPTSLHDDFIDAINAFRRLEVVGAMRSLWTAGKALEADNIAGFNCAYTPIKHPKDFAEVLHILMNGTGVGISVERQYINQLFTLPNTFHRVEETIVVRDSKRGWAEGFYKLLKYLYHGKVPKYDLSKIRPAGARLKTFGGRASGPEPLRDLFEFTIGTFFKAAGGDGKLTSEHVADICCKIAECVVVGGVRRSAILILTNPSDRRMANFKNGEFWRHHPHRALANISSCYTEKPESINFMEDMLDLMKSGNGERGIVNREALKSMCLNHRDDTYDFGINPCGEIILRPKEFCNLTEVILRPQLTKAEVQKRIKHAVLLGIAQATMTNFQFISKEWQKNTEEERLLGVSLTGMMDAHNQLSPNRLANMRSIAHEWAFYYAEELNINPPTAVTCVKPSGTVSQLVDSSSGIHPRYSEFYIRRVRVATTDPIARFLMDHRVPCQPETGQSWDTVKTVVFEFPMKAPANAVTTADVSTLYQLDWWRMTKQYYTDHDLSVTIFVTKHEWPEVSAWLYRNWNILGGITLLPHDDSCYPLQPYESISQQEYQELADNSPPLDWTKLDEYEETDNTIGRTEFACAEGNCEI
jgi:ribonucleoside-diphosphate reductase alpha chain